MPRIKIVYFGVGLAGKSSSLLYIYHRTDPARRSVMTSHATESERLLYFDFEPKTVECRLHLVTVPGAVFYEKSRSTLLEGAGGIVFVVDSQRERREQNIESQEQLTADADPTCPRVLQYNKCDLPNRMTREDLDSTFNPGNEIQSFETNAQTGKGIFEVLRAITEAARAKAEWCA